MNLQTINASASPEVQMNENFETLEHQAVYGKRHPVTTGLTWGYCGGRWGGFAIAAGTVALTDDAANYLVVEVATGALSASTAATNWDDGAAYVRVYKITTASGLVTAVEDHRPGPGGVHGMPSQSALARAAVTVLSIVSGDVTIDCSLGDYFTLALSADVTSLTFTNLPGAGNGATKFVRITQDPTLAHTFAFPGSARWEGTAPAVSTALGAIDLLAMTTFDNGTTWDMTLSKGRT